MDLTRQTRDEAEDPIKIQNPDTEEEEHHESGASKMFRRVKAKAKKIKNSLTKQGQGHENDHDVDEEDESDEQSPKVDESSAVRSGVTGQNESLSHATETNVPAPEHIIPPETKVVPVMSSDDNRPVEAEPSHPVRVTDLSDREESIEAVTRTVAPGEDEDLEGQRKVNIETPKRLEEEGSDYTSDVSNYQSKVINEGGGETAVLEIADDQKSGLGFENDLPMRSQEFERETKSGTGKDSPAPRFGEESGAELGKDFPTKSFEFDQKIESVIDKDSPAGFGGKPETELREDFPAKSHEIDLQSESGIGKDTGFGGEQGTEQREDFLAKSHEFDLEIESGIGKDSPTGFDRESETGQRGDFPAKSHEFDLKIESGIGNDTGFGEKPGTEQREDFLAKSHEFDQEIESGIGKESSTGFDGDSETGLGEYYPASSHELGLINDSGIGKDSPTESHGYGKESEAGLETKFPASNDDMKVENVFGRDSPSRTHDQFSPEDDFKSQADERRDETQEPKPITYTEQIGSATSFITDKAIDAKNVVASRLGNSGGEHESSVGEVVGTGSEELSPVDEKDKERGSTVTTKMPVSGGGSEAEETEQERDKGVSAKDYLAEKLKPGEEDKALSELMTEKLNLGGKDEKKTTIPKEVEVTEERIPSDKLTEEKEHSKVVAEEVNGGGGGMVGKIKGAVTSWFGGATEEVKPKSPGSVEESSQSLGSTVRD